jgi:hypothetical protein
MGNQTPPVVDPKEDVDRKVTTPPLEQGEVAGGTPLETPDAAFRNEMFADRGLNPSINSRDKSDLTVKPTSVAGADGVPVPGVTYKKGNHEFFVSNRGEEYRQVERNGVKSWQPMSAEARQRPLAPIQPTGDQAAVTGPQRKVPAVDQTADLVPPAGAPRRVQTETGDVAADGRKLNPQRELTHLLAPADMNNLRKQFADLPKEQRDAAWNQAYTAAKQRLDSGVAPRTEGLVDRTTLPGKVVERPAAVAAVDAKPAKDAVAPAVEGKPLKDGVAVAPAQQLIEQQRAAAARYTELMQGGQEKAAERYLNGVKKDLGPESVGAVLRESQRIREAAVANPAEGPGKIRTELPVQSLPANLSGKELPIGKTPVDAVDRTPRQVIQDQLATLRAQRDQLEGPQKQAIQEQIAALKAQQRELGEAPGHGRENRGDLAGREIKLPGEQSQRPQIDMKQVAELMRQPKDQPFPPGLENKFKNNPDVLAALQQGWKEARDRDGKAGELGLRGRGDAGDQAARALDALKGGSNQKGIPGFDLNDKATREFLNDAMKRLELAKGQRVEDIFKGLDPTKAERLTKFLAEGSTDGKFNPARVKDFMGMSDALKNPTERLYDFLKVNKDLINNQQLSAKDTQRMLGDLTKILGDVNKQLGVDGTRNALNIQDILGRKLDPTRPGERLAAMEQNGINRMIADRPDALAMTARMTAAQEVAIRQMLDMRNGRDPLAPPAARTGQEGMQAGRETAAGARFEGPQARMDAAQVAAQNAARMDAQNRPDLSPTVRPEAKPDGTFGKPDALQVQKQLDIAVPGSKPVEAKGPDAIGAMDRKDEKFLDEKSRLQKKEEEEKEKHEKEEQHKREEKARLDALMLAALAEKKRKVLEQEQKEKEKSEEKDKQRDREKRRRYIVREKDTLQSIATAQLRDVKLSPLIYEINKEVIQLRVENGKQVPDLKPKMIIWLPSTTEIEEFRKGGIAGAKAAGTPQDKKMTADEELIARFGAGWKGGATGGPSTGGVPTGGTPTVIPGSQPATSSQVTAALAASAMEAAQKKRANIESLLGPIGRQKPADGRIKYIARLGDSLKSVAMKHPALQDVNLWRLIAEINGISTEVDSRGGPIATLSRGAVLMIPSNVDVENFRQRASGAPQAVLTTGGVKTGGVITEVATKLCEGCGRMTVNSATICPACGNAFETSAGDDSDSDSEEVASDTNTGHGIALEEEPPVAYTDATGAPEDAKTVFVAAQEFADEDAPTRINTGNQTIENLRDDCRLVKCDGQGIVCQLEVWRDGGWEPVVSYEIYDDVSLRNEHTQDGRKRSVRIDLPPAAAKELASNDLNSNWKAYCGRFLGQQIA